MKPAMRRHPWADGVAVEFQYGQQEIFHSELQSAGNKGNLTTGVPWLHLFVIPGGRKEDGLRPFMVLLLCLLTGLAGARELRVRLEPFPPLIRGDGTGLVVRMLKDLAREHDLDLDIKILSYSRAKYQLRNGEADLIGLVPLSRETERFYSYARELEWHLDARADLFSHSAQWLDGTAWKQHRVGTPWGNAAFFSDSTGVDEDRFVESSLPSLARMLRGHRIDVLLFGRVSTMTVIRELGLKGIHYRNLYEIPAGFAVADTERGRALMKRLEPLLTPPEKLSLFADYLDYADLPPRGVVGEAMLAADPD